MRVDYSLYWKDRNKCMIIFLWKWDSDCFIYMIIMMWQLVLPYCISLNFERCTHIEHNNNLVTKKRIKYTVFSFVSITLLRSRQFFFRFNYIISTLLFRSQSRFLKHILKALACLLLYTEQIDDWVCIICNASWTSSV